MTRTEYERLEAHIRKVWVGSYKAEPEANDLYVAATEYRRCRLLMRDRLHAIASR